MVDVAAGHKHALGSTIDEFHADCAAGWFHLTLEVFTMFLFNFDDRKLVHCRFLGCFATLPLLGFLLTHATNHLEKIIARKVLIKIIHKVVWVEAAVGHLHTQELPSIEYVHKVA